VMFNGISVESSLVCMFDLLTRKMLVL